jgi:hypothetical protein
MRQNQLNILLDEQVRLKGIGVGWKNSVVYLLKLLSLDSSLQARALLGRRWNIFAGENGEAVQNIALHDVIMDEIAKNQGRAPNSLARALCIDIKLVHY